MIVIEPFWPMEPGEPKSMHPLIGGVPGIEDMFHFALEEFSRLPNPKWSDFNPREELLEHHRRTRKRRHARLIYTVPVPHRLIIGEHTFLQPAMIYSSNRWDAVDGPLASAWEAVPLYLRFRKYQAGEHCYLARAEHTFLLNFVTHDTPLGFRGPHYCPNSSGLWIASAEGDDKPKVFDVDGFRDFFARLRVNRLLWWRAFEDEEEARKWNPIPDPELREWLSRSRLRLREDWRNPKRKTLSFRTAKPSIQQDFYAVFVNGAKTLYTDKAKLEKHLAECPDAEWQKFDNIKDALAWTGGGGAEAAGDNTTSGRVIETSAEKGLERASNDPSEGTEQAEIGEAEISDLGGRVSPGSSSSGSTADRLSPLSDDRPLSSGLSVDLDNEPVEEEIVKPAPAENQDEKAVESRVDQAAGSGSAKSAVQPPSELASAEDIEEPEPSSPLLSTLQHEIEWCRSYPATNSNWVPVRFSFDGRIVSPR